MRLMSFRVLALLALAAALGAGLHGQQRSPANRPWPPALQKLGPDSPPLSPAESLSTFYMPPGYHIELVASEPLIQDPVAIDWDPDGRLYAVEMTGFVRDLQTPEPNLDPIGRVVVLEDTNRDGTMDKRTVFADQLKLPRAVKVLDRGVLVGEPGSLSLMRDTNGDLRADTKELVTDAYGRLYGSVEGNGNSLLWGLDNWMHTAGSVEVYLRLKDGKFDVRQTLSRGEWGASQDDAGRIYRNTNESALHVDLVPTPYFARNPSLLRTRGSYERLADANPELNTVWPVRPNPGTNRAYQFGIDREDGTLARFTAVCAPMVYRGDRLPVELYGNVFVAEPAANLVSRIIVSDDGTTLRARKAYDKGEFLASTDERFRPVYISNAPDGTIYIVDFHRGILQDRASTTEYLRDYIISRKLEAPIGRGRIYRVMHDTTRRDVAPALSKASRAQLVQTLAHPNGWWRETAQRLLVERGVGDALPALIKLAEATGDSRARLHALWTLDGVDQIEPALVMNALNDPSRDVRMSALRLAERWLGTVNHPIQAAVLARLDDPDWSVKAQLAASIGALPSGPRETAVASLLGKYAEDAVVMDAALSGIRGSEPAVLEKLIALEGAATRPREVAVGMVAAMIVRSGQDATVQSVFASIADERGPIWQRSAMMSGAEAALLGGPLPGTATARRGGAPTPAPAGPAPPCPTCPGGRAGPGGAYAFRDTTVAPASGRGGGSRTLRLNREPSALSGLAAQSGDLGSRAARLLARVEWPGKPGAAAPIPPLTPEEQQRFNAGQEVYKNICQACHQADGRGQDKIAPSLVGSTFALAAAEIPARILLNGKEGSIGLMPPLGATLGDDQIAAVLTYIRREWGQDGTAVNPGTIKTVRTEVAGRTRAWTTEELMKLMGGGR